MERLKIERDGAQLLVRRWRSTGTAKGVLVALHGVISHSGWFDLFGPELAARGITVLAPDRRGSGPLPRALPQTFEVWLDDLRSVLARAAEDGPPSLLGWSWGARLAIVAAAREPQVRRLVLMAPGLVMVPSVNQRLAHAIQQSERPDDDLPLPFDNEDFSEVASVRAFLDSDVDSWSKLPRAWARLSRELQLKAEEVLPSIRQPVLAVMPDHDRMVDLVATGRLLERGETITLPGGHALILENPARSADCVAQWLGR